MSVAFLLDESQRGRLFNATERHNREGLPPLDIVCVGQPDDLPLSSSDPAILLWAERENRILISADCNTLPDHLANHLAAGHHSPGVFLVRPGTSLAALVEHLVLVAHASDDYEWRDHIEFVP